MLLAICQSLFLRGGGLTEGLKKLGFGQLIFAIIVVFHKRAWEFLTDSSANKTRQVNPFVVERLCA